ncbi:unnamed protein product [Gongylonema pulchrum]|uniref:Uncharacterized protein n=1 Tax=Gongylonema pulchrum TaxID=637853 RepID=A0A3P6UGT6_9BILA|nr:unnamed protein product [Gongylonema pulchrum]
MEQIPALTREVDRLRTTEEQLSLHKRQLDELRDEYGDLQNQGTNCRFCAEIPLCLINTSL